MLFYFIRHGNPIYDPDCLTPLGKRQAEAVGRRLAMHGLDKIFISSSTRAKETAAPAAELLKIQPVELDWCNESYAAHDFMQKASDGNFSWLCFNPDFRKLLVSPEIVALGDKWYTHPAFAGLPYEAGVMRIDREVDAFFLSLGYKHDRVNRIYEPIAPTDERVALFAHQGFSWLFFSSMLDIPYPTFATHFDIQHTGVSVVEFVERAGCIIPRVLQHSSDGHLYAEHLPTKYGNEFFI